MGKLVLPFDDNPYWRVALLRAVTSQWDNVGDAAWSLRHLYEPNDKYIFETHETRYYIYVSVLLREGFLEGMFDIHEHAVVDQQIRKENQARIS